MELTVMEGDGEAFEVQVPTPTEVYSAAVVMWHEITI